MVKAKRKRPYKSLARERQAEDTRRRIVAATRDLLDSEGYDRMTIEAIARRAEVSAPSVYAIFKSKAGIMAELLDRSSFGPDYESSVQEAEHRRSRIQAASGGAHCNADSRGAKCNV